MPQPIVAGLLARLLPAEQWRRNQIAVTIAAAMVFFGFTLFMPFLPFYVKELGVHDRREVAVWSGIFLTVSPLLASILGPVWGRLGDRVGMKIMVERVLLTITVHWGLMYFARTVWQVLALRILLGLFSGFGTMSVALVTHGCPRERIGRAVGTLQAAQILSTAFGPFVGGILAQSLGIRSTFVVTFFLCLAALLFVAALYGDTRAAADEGAPEGMVVSQEGPVTAGVRAVVAPPSPAAPEAAGRLTLRDVFGLPFLMPLLPLLFLVNLVDRSLALSVPLYLASLAGPGMGVEAVTGIVVSAGAFASAGSAYLLGHRAVRVGSMRLLLVGLIGGLAAIVPMGLCRSILPFAILRVLVGASVGGAATLAYTLGGAQIPSHVRASGYSLLSSAAMLGGAMGPILCGLLTSIDLRAPFFASGLIYLGLALHVAGLRRRMEPAAEPLPVCRRIEGRP